MEQLLQKHCKDHKTSIFCCLVVDILINTKMQLFTIFLVERTGHMTNGE